MSWDELQPEFRKFVLRRGEQTLQEVADALPADRGTIRRLIDGTTKHPSRAMQAAVERLLQVQRSDEDDDDD
jgi:hypothetical protein